MVDRHVIPASRFDLYWKGASRDVRTRLSLSNETLALIRQFSEGCENFDRSGAPKLYVASPFEGDGVSLLASERAFVTAESALSGLIAFPGNELSLPCLLAFCRRCCRDTPGRVWLMPLWLFSRCQMPRF
jgi:hypothetical protein